MITDFSAPRRVFGALGVMLLATLLAGPPAASARQLQDERARVIAGRVLGTDGTPLPGANVAIPALQRGVATGADGRFRLADLPAQRVELVVSFVGFVTEQREVDLAAHDAVGAEALTIRLAPAQIEADEIVVTSQGHADLLTRGARSIAVLDAEDLADIRGQTLGAALAELPGVTTQTTGPSLAKPVVRGLTGSRVTVVNGGVAQEGQQWGREHAPEIDPFAPVQIEVIKGASSVEYGAGAIGGVIRLVPLPLPQRPGVGGELLANGFSNNRQAAGSVMVEGTTRGPWAARVQVSARGAGDSRTPGYVLGNTAFREASAHATLGYRRGRLALEASARHFGTTLGLFTGAHISNLADLMRAIERGEPAVEHTFGYGIDAPKQEITHDVGSLRARYRLPSGGLFEATYAAQRNHRQEFDKHRGSTGKPAFDLVLITQSLEAAWTRRPGAFAGGEAFVRAGVSGMTQGNENIAVGKLLPNFRALTGGGFAHATLVRGGWTWEAGGRYDARHVTAYPSDSGTERGFRRATHTYGSLSGVAGALWRMGPGWSLAANIGTGWRPPGVSELYSSGVHHGTAQVEVGDATLGPERSVDVSATLRHAGGEAARPRVQMEVSAFANRIDGYLFLRAEPEPTVTIRGVFPTFYHDQTDALLAGVDGSLVSWVAPWMRVGASLSVVRGTDREATHAAARPLADMPSDRLRLSARFERGQFGFLGHPHIDIEGVLVREQTRVPDAFAYAPPPPGYALLHLHLRTDVRLGALTRQHPAHVSLSVENVFDTAHRDYLSRLRFFADDPGRSIVLRVTVPFGARPPLAD